TSSRRSAWAGVAPGAVDATASAGSAGWSVAVGMRTVYRPHRTGRLLREEEMRDRVRPASGVEAVEVLEGGEGAGRLEQRRPEREQRGMARRTGASGGVERAAGLPGQSEHAGSAQMLGGDETRYEGDRVPGAHQVHLQQRIRGREAHLRLDARLAPLRARPGAGPA